MKRWPGADDGRGAFGFQPRSLTMTDPARPPRQTENENQRLPAREGEAPRPATEPRGEEGSSNSGETATDPATGTPNE
jgi:hypothetical protein